MAGPVDFAFVGGLRQDYCITHDGRVFAGMLGGNALYAAVGARVWGASVGVVGRVGSDFPSAWLERLRDEGFNLDGVRVLPDPQDTRTFYAYLSPDERVDTSPASHFLRVGHALPKELLGYQHSTLQQDRRAEPGRLAVRAALDDDHRAAHSEERLGHLPHPQTLRTEERLRLHPTGEERVQTVEQIGKFAAEAGIHVHQRWIECQPLDPEMAEMSRDGQVGQVVAR